MNAHQNQTGVSVEQFMPAVLTKKEETKKQVPAISYIIPKLCAGKNR